MPGSLVDALLQAPRDRQRYVLLARAGFADRAGIDAAVAGIDRDDHVAAVRIVRGFHDHGRRVRRTRTEIDDEPVTIARPRARR